MKRKRFCNQKFNILVRIKINFMHFMNTSFFIAAISRILGINAIHVNGNRIFPAQAQLNCDIGSMTLTRFCQ